MINSEKFAILLKELGRPADSTGNYSCPVHSGRPGTLHFNPNEILPGGFHIVCTYPRCNFSGSILELAAAAKKCSMQEAAHLFAPGGTLHGLFFESLGNDAADQSFITSELMRAEAYHKAAEYLVEAKVAFLNNIKARQFLASKGIKEDLFQKLMCGTPCPNAPDRLHHLPAKNMEQYVVLPYMSGGLATDVSIYDIRDGSRTQLLLEKKSRGIFLSEFLPVAAVDRLTVCNDELDAMVMLTKISDVGISGINPVAVIDPAAVLQIPGLQSIVLLSHADKQMRASHVMDYLRLSPGIKVSVLELPGALSVISPTKIRRIFEGTVDGWSWLTAKLHSISKNEGLEILIAQLTSLGLSKSEKNTILAKMRELGIMNSMMVEEVRNARPACMICKCGSLQIKRTFAGYEQVLPYGKQLSNFILIVNYFTGTTEDKIMAATIKTDKPGCPGYDIAIPVKDLRTKDGNKITYIIWNKLVELGVKFNIEASNVTDIDWFWLICMFDNADYKEQSKLIGVEGHIVRYPAMKINMATGVTTTLDILPGLPEIMTSSYGLVAGRTHDTGELAPSLRSKKDDAVDSFLGIMGHILSETARAARPGYKPKHLIIPYTFSESVTDTMVGQVNMMLGGGDEIRTMPSSGKESDKFFKDWKMLGRLPMICRAQDKVTKFAANLNQAYGSMVVLYPVTSLPPHSSLANAYYMSEILDRDHYELSQEVLDMLRSRWASMLSATYLAVDSLDKDMPAISWMHKFCGSAPDSYLFTLRPFIETGTDSYQDFLNSLAHLVNLGLVTLAPDKESFLSKNRSDTDIGFYKSSNIIQLFPTRMYTLMEMHGAVFNWKSITSHAAHNGLWVTSSSSQRTVEVSIWDSLMVKNFSLKMLTFDDIEVKTA